MLKIIKKIFASVFAAAMLLVCFSGVPSGVKADATDEITYVLDSCDNADYCITAGQGDKTNFVEGTGSLYTNNDAGRVTFVFGDIDYGALPPESSAYLEFYYWVEDAENIYLGQIELNSSGYADVNEINYDLSASSGLTTGWNFISVKLTQMKTEGPFSYGKIYGLRIFMLPKKTNSFICRVDNIVLTNVSHAEQVAASGITAKSLPPVILNRVVSENVYK
jgi:hypothetical protein